MTFAAFRSIVLAYTQVHGQQYVTETADVNVVLNDGLAQWSRMALSLWSDRIVFTPTQGVAVYRYDVPSAAFTIGATQVALTREIFHLNWDGKPLRDLHGRIGPVDLDDVRHLYPSYQTDPSSTPIHWWRSPRDLFVYPAPSSGAISGATKAHHVNAFYVHPPLSGDSDAVLLNDAEARLAAMQAAIFLLQPFSADIGEEKVLRLQAELEARAALLAKDNMRSVGLQEIVRGPYDHDITSLA